MPTAQLAELTPAIDWPQFFARTGVPGIADLNVANPDFFKGLQAVLDSTDLETIKTYLRWQLMHSTPHYALPKAIDDARFRVHGHELQRPAGAAAALEALRCGDRRRAGRGAWPGLCGFASFPPRAKHTRCKWSTTSKLPWTTELDTQAWMSAETKDKAKAKLHMVADKIGYPDHWRDYSKLDRGSRRRAWQCTRARQNLKTSAQLAKIGKPVDRGEWITTPATVNAFYNPIDERHQLSRGNSAGAGFTIRKATDAENYGHIGVIVGHELTHGFDDQGSQFDGNGNLSDWWTADDRKKFDAMTDCEVKEYGNFTAVDDVKVNGKLTLGENTADNGGLRLAYMAFLADAKRKGIDLTAKQDRLHAACSSSSWRSGRIGAAPASRARSGCWCRPIRIPRILSAPMAWCRI